MRDLASMLFVGLDIGGTKMVAAIVTGSGEVIARHRKPTPRGGTAKQNLRAALDTVAELLDAAAVNPRAIAGIGMGAPGVVDPDAGCVVYAPNLSMADLNVVKPAKKRFGRPVALGNDVNVGTLGEQWAGAARGAESAFGIMVGTGIGGGLIMDRKLVVGARFAAAEIGHIVMQPTGPKCGCGRRGCLEALASRLAIERDIRLAVKAGRKTVLTDLLDGDLSSIRSKALSRALRKRDPLVADVVRRAAEWIGYACVTVRHIVDPEVIVLGGGVMEACGDYVMPVVERIVEDRSMPGAKSKARVVRSELGDDAGVMGAVALVQQSMGFVPFGGNGAPPPPEEAGTAAPAVEKVSLVGTKEVKAGGRTWTRDILIRADGKVKPRRKSHIKAKLGGTHVIEAQELAKALKGKPATLFLGGIRKGCPVLSKKARALLKKIGTRLVSTGAGEAVRLYNSDRGPRALIVHLACK